MKKQLLLLAGLIFLSFAGFAQANLVVFSEDGDQFYAFVNGVRQNDKPETNVKITGINGNASLRIEFADKTLPQLKQFMALEPGFEHTARIKRDMKKQMKLRYFGQVPLNEATSSGAATVQYHTAENPGTYNTADNSSPANSINNNNSMNNNISMSGSTVTTKTSNGTNANPDNVAVNINMAGTGISMNVNDPANSMMNTTTSTTVTSSSSYTTTSSGFDNSNNNNNNHNHTYNNHNPKAHNNNNSYNNPPANANVGCSTAMPSASFSKMKQTIESKPFSDTKMSTAKVATKNACLSTAQVKEICKLFSMDNDKLTYAKYAYQFCIDKANYYQVSEVFSFSSTTDEFNKFLEQ